MNVLCFEGGLGNQMFQYAFYLGERKRHGGLWVFDRSGSRGHHQGFEINRIFGVCCCKKLNNFILRVTSALEWTKEIVNEEDGAYYRELPKANGVGKIVVYKGFWQSEKYFLNVEQEVRRNFRFDISKLNKKSQSLYVQFTKKNHPYVSIHVRRGDYMDDPERQVCTTDYYMQAISYIKNHVKEASFVIFSDDIPWCKAQFGQEDQDICYVDWNKGKDSWQDMCLMSRCTHHIIANSSFSWWGAWLDDNVDKIVICPKRWNVGYPEDTDKIPVRWIRL